MKNLVMLEVVEQFKKLAALEAKQINGVLPLGSQARLRLHRIQKSINSSAEAFEQARLSLFKEFGTKDEANDSYTIPAEKLAGFKQEFNQLLEADAEVNVTPIHDEVLAAAGVPLDIILGLARAGVVSEGGTP